MPETTCNFVKQEGSDLCVCTKCGYETKYCNASKRCRMNRAVQSPKNELQPPSLLTRVINFTTAATKHAVAGNPVVSEEILKERLSICKSCELFKPNANTVGGVCTHATCGCNIQDNLNYLNKIAWADSFCPIKKWDRVDDTK